MTMTVQKMKMIAASMMTFTGEDTELEVDQLIRSAASSLDDAVVERKQHRVELDRQVLATLLETILRYHDAHSLLSDVMGAVDNAAAVAKDIAERLQEVLGVADTAHQTIYNPALKSVIKMSRSVD